MANLKGHDQTCKEYKNTHLTKEDFIRMLEQMNGNIYAAEKAIGLPASRLLRWRKEDKEFDDKIAEIKNNATRVVENIMFDFINGNIGDTHDQLKMVQFYLRANGYAEQKNIKINSTNTVDVNAIIDDLKNDLSN